MPAKINLDAMIPRADFAAQSNEDSSVEKIQSISVEQLTQNSMLVHRLRKPDFQRETNHWSIEQL
ncbi:hypothetical protein [Kiloniella sp.]|uniref:hypothetical protein n=1 Tax=Kiloniella sp. TaxID=1938587 RepID=UPI003B01DCC9